MALQSADWVNQKLPVETTDKRKVIKLHKQIQGRQKIY